MRGRCMRGGRRPLPSVIDNFRARAEESQARVHLLAGWPEVAALALDLAHGEPIAVASSLARTHFALVDLLGARMRLADAEAPARSTSWYSDDRALDGRDARGARRSRARRCFFRNWRCRARHRAIRGALP